MRIAWWSACGRVDYVAPPSGCADLTMECLACGKRHRLPTWAPVIQFACDCERSRITTQNGVSISVNQKAIVSTRGVDVRFDLRQHLWWWVAELERAKHERANAAIAAWNEEA